MKALLSSITDLIILYQATKLEAENYLRNENELARKKNQLYQMHLMEASENVEISKKAVVRIQCIKKETRQYI